MKENMATHSSGQRSLVGYSPGVTQSQTQKRLSSGSSGIPKGFPGGAVVKNPAAHAGDTEIWVLSLGQEDSLEEESGNSLQYACLENSMDRIVWQATVHRVTKSQTRLSD